ncbi:hypothetical protein [Streptomyces sp. M41(2017)]|uniref:hypothetical protein n=1 Tax=Streptomyces sp. M41(2017) TaxID=1955065 RepID=UPI001180E75D|nr:hypothetical protein [Streptomyces sp. M41(2017)]
MDQGVAGVWAASVAGFASAAGAAMGAGLAARGARVQSLQQSELEKQRSNDEQRRQHHEWLRQRCLTFQEKLGFALTALDDLMYALVDGQPTKEARDKLRKAESDMIQGHFDCVLVCGVDELTRISVTSLEWFEEATKAVDALRKDPGHVADIESPLNRRWIDRRRGLVGAYEMYAGAIHRNFRPI